MVKLTGEIVQQSENYFGAISTSMAMAKSGCRSAAQAAELGESMGSSSGQRLQMSLVSMLQIVTETSTQSENIEGSFGNVCAGFVRVIQSSLILSPLAYECAGF